MHNPDIVTGRYLSEDYRTKNPSWDTEDSAWKAQKVVRLISNLARAPESVCDVGCGAGRILVELKKVNPTARYHGFDIAPAAAEFWKQCDGIDFQLGDFFKLNLQTYDLILLLDVLEHVADPFAFLSQLRSCSPFFVFHFPLDLSAMSVLRETPLLHVREKVGHIHYFTKQLALTLLRECGYDVIKWEYTNAAFSSPNRGFKTRLASVPRRLMYRVNKDFGVRLLGGETLMVLAKTRADLG